MSAIRTLEVSHAMNTAPLNIGLFGFGRMGQAIYDCLKGNAKLTCSGIKVRDFEAYARHEASPLITTDAEFVVTSSNVLIDFSTPEGVLNHIDAAIAHKTPILIGVTGLNDTLQARVKEASKVIPICLAPNTSLAIAIMNMLIENAAILLDDTYDIEVFEAHHRNKADAPSGTALMLGDAAARGRHLNLNDAKVYPHHEKRKKGEIGFSVARGGGITSEHTVYFYGEDDVLSFSHRSLNRSLYAKGALKLAQLLAIQKQGLYTPQDLLLSA